MLFNVYKSLSIRQKPSTKAKSLCIVPMNKRVTITGKKYVWDKNIPYVKVKYNDIEGYVNAKYIKGLVIKRKANKNPKYPLTAILSNGKNNLRVKVAKQHNFGDYISKHGCSIVAISEALESLKIRRTPEAVNKYCRSNYRYNGSKVAIHGAYKAVKEISKKDITYYSVTKQNKRRMKKKILNALSSGRRVVIEQKNPIHTYVALGYTLSGKVIIASSGKLENKTISWIMKTINVGDGSKSDYFTGSNADAGIFIV